MHGSVFGSVYQIAFSRGKFSLETNVRCDHSCDKRCHGAVFCVRRTFTLHNSVSFLTGQKRFEMCWKCFEPWDKLSWRAAMLVVFPYLWANAQKSQEKHLLDNEVFRVSSSVHHALAIFAYFFCALESVFKRGGEMTVHSPEILRH